MAKEIDCPCGKTVRGEDDDELVANTEAHIQEQHPEMVGTRSREDILAMAHDAEISCLAARISSALPTSFKNRHIRVIVLVVSSGCAVATSC
jgi:predicted small metal-binding protein